MRKHGTFPFLNGDLKLKFKAVEAMDDYEKMVVASLIDAYIKKHRMERVLAQ